MKDIMKPMEQKRVMQQQNHVSISQNLQKKTDFIDGWGNIIDPVTKQIIKRNTDRDSKE